MVPILISGVVVPWDKSFAQGHRCNFKLVTRMGFEYFLTAGPEWEGLLSACSWEEVKVRGFVNAENRTIIPKKIYPKNPTTKRKEEVAIDELDQGKMFDLSFIQRRLGHGFSVEPRMEEIGGAYQ